MVCKECKQEITLSFFGMPENICWGCLEQLQKETIIYKHATLIIINKN
jgi:hypothetical protein